MIRKEPYDGEELPAEMPIPAEFCVGKGLRSDGEGF
jgi:hypothetical protein